MDVCPLAMRERYKGKQVQSSRGYNHVSIWVLPPWVGLFQPLPQDPPETLCWELQKSMEALLHSATSLLITFLQPQRLGDDGYHSWLPSTLYPPTCVEKPNSLGGMECLPWLQAQASVGSDYTPNHSDWGEVAQVMLRVTDSGHSCLLSRVSVRATNERREATDEEAYGARNRQHRSGCQPEDEAGTERTGPKEPQRPNPSPDNSMSLVNKHPPHTHLSGLHNYVTQQIPLCLNHRSFLLLATESWLIKKALVSSKVRHRC